LIAVLWAWVVMIAGRLLYMKVIESNTYTSPILIPLLDFLLQPETYSFGLEFEILKGPHNDYEEYHMGTMSENMI